jgi:hypothetical protein
VVVDRLACRAQSAYVAEQRARSRSVRRSLVQRAGADLALVGLAQEGEVVSLDGVDERRKSKCSMCYLVLLL